MYIMHLPLYATLIIMNVTMDAKLQGDLIHALLVAALILMGIMVPVCVLNIIVSLREALKGNVDPTKTTMIAKLCLIPWYVLNFIIGFSFTAIFFNPFMMFAIPVIAVLLISSTYILMISTSLGDIAYFLRSTAKKNGTVRPLLTVALICLFIFCLDVVGAIVFYKKSDEIRLPAQTDDAPAEQN